MEVESLELSDSSVTRQLKKEANNLVSNTAADVTRILMDEFNWANRKNRVEIQGQVKHAVTTIFDFVSGGSRIDVWGEGESEKEAHQQLVEAFSRIRGVENRLGQFQSETGGDGAEKEA